MQETNQDEQLRATERLIEDICIQRETLRANFTAVHGGMDQYSQSATRMIENADKLLIDIYAMIDRMNATIEGTRETLRRVHEKRDDRLSVRLANAAAAPGARVVPMLRPEPERVANDGLKPVEANM